MFAKTLIPIIMILIYGDCLLLMTTPQLMSSGQAGDKSTKYNIVPKMYRDAPKLTPIINNHTVLLMWQASVD